MPQQRRRKDSDVLRRQVGGLVAMWRSELEGASRIDKLHLAKARVIKVDEKHYTDPRPFTKAFARYLDKPPDFLTVMRRRRYPERHYQEGHEAWKTCKCRERLGYRLVHEVVVMRTFIDEPMRKYQLTETRALTVLGAELRTIANMVERGKDYGQHHARR